MSSNVSSSTPTSYFKIILGNVGLRRNPNVNEKTITIMSADNTQLDVVAENESAFHYWSDAINYLLGREC